jgi:hypothetical protein
MFSKNDQHLSSATVVAWACKMVAEDNMASHSGYKSMALDSMGPQKSRSGKVVQGMQHKSTGANPRSFIIRIVTHIPIIIAIITIAVMIIGAVISFLIDFMNNHIGESSVDALIDGTHLLCLGG